jgi:hypothetical protein
MIRLVFLAMIVAGCADNQVCLPMPIDEPVQYPLPSVSKSELSCLTKEAYEKLELRDRTRYAFGRECLKLIRGHNAGAN